MLIQSLIWCCDDIVIYYDDWSLYYNEITTSCQWLINIPLTLSFEHIVKTFVVSVGIRKWVDVSFACK